MKKRSGSVMKDLEGYAEIMDTRNDRPIVVENININ